MRDDASRTAVLVCEGRAAAHDRIAVGRFSDPVALELLDPDEREVVEHVRRESPPSGRAARVIYEFVRRCATLMVPRTVAIDDAVAEHPTGQVIVLGAGLDARAWRMRELADATVLEVDHPASQNDKRRRLGTRTPTARVVRFVSTDFSDQDLDRALERAGHDAATPSTWVWEGVVPYLTAAQVAATVAVVERRSAPSSRLVVSYQVRSATAGFGRLLARLAMRAAGAPDPWRDEPQRSHWTPTQLATLLDEHGFSTVRDHDLRQISATLGLPPRADDPAGSLVNGRVLVADRR